MKIIFMIAALLAVFFVHVNCVLSAVLVPPDPEEVVATTTETTSTTTSTTEAVTTTLDITPTTTVETTDTSTPSTEEVVTTTVTTTLSVEVAGTWQKLFLSEFVSDPESGNEWVEIYNANTSPYNLTGGYVCDNRETTSTCKMPSSTISAESFGVVEWAGSYLNNSGGDSVRLLDPFYAVIDEFVYGTNIDTTPIKGQSYAKNSSGQWKISTTITKGFANTITEVVKPAPTSGGGGGGGGSVQAKTTETSIVAKDLSFATTSSYWGKVLINEIFPDPNGSDAEEEFVEISNITSSTISLSGWRLYDNGGYYILSGELVAGEVKGYKRKDTGLVLGNSGDDIVLVDSGRNLVDKVKYDKADTGRSYCRSTSGWQWSDTVSFGLINVIEQDDAVKIIWKIKYPSGAAPNEKIVFDAEGSADPRGGSLQYLWDLGDTTTSTGGEVEHAYSASGTYKITLSVTSTAGTVGTKEMTVQIGEGLSIANPNVLITEILPNPEGVDDNEFFEITNTGSTTISLDNWLVKTTAADKYVIPEGTNILPQTSLVFFRRATKLNLTNDNGKVELYNDNQEIIDSVKYSSGGSGLSYAKNLQGEWVWALPTPYVFGGGVIINNTKIASIGVRSGKTISYTRTQSVGEVKELGKDSAVSVAGVVLVEPGIMGSQYFYIADDTAGIQVYQYKKMFPPIRLGDRVVVKGVISEYSGKKRIKVSRLEDIDILSTGNGVNPVVVNVLEIGEENIGQLIQVSGDITEIKSGWMYLDDTAGEVAVYFKPGADITKASLKEGDSVTVIGILEQGKNGWQVWPRNNEDIQVVGLAKEVNPVSSGIADKIGTYLTAFFGGASSLALGLLAKARGAGIRIVFGKVIKIAADLVKKA